MEFESDTKIPSDIQSEITKTEVGQTHEAAAAAEYLKDVAEEIAEMGVRERLLSRGYFRALTDVKLAVVKTEGSNVDVSATVVAELGEQFRTGEVRFKSADPDKTLSRAPEGLRDLIPLKRGELLDVGKIREGLRNLTDLYGRDGYIDMVAEPEFYIDDHKGIVDMTVSVDAGIQYRVRAIDFRGADPVLERRLRESLQRSGEVVDKSRLDQFVFENASLFSSTADRVVQIHRDVYAGTIDLMFDLRSCRAA